MTTDFSVQQFRKLAIAIVLLVFGASLASAQIPQTLSFQGELAPPVQSNSTQNMTFKIYTAASGGSALWTETQSVQLAGRRFNVILGSVTTLDLPFDQQYYIGVTVGAGSELSPRVKLTSTPYSFRSKVADSAGTAGTVPDGSITPAKLDATGAVAGQTLVYDGSDIGWAYINKLDLPFAQSAASGSALFHLTNTGAGGVGKFEVNNGSNASAALEAVTNGTSLNSSAILGRRGTSGLTLGISRAILGDNGGSGAGVAGLSDAGPGVYGASNDGQGMMGVALATDQAGVLGRNDVSGGYGVYGQSLGAATGVYGTSQTGTAGKFAIANTTSTADALIATHAGNGSALFAQITKSSSTASIARMTTNGIGSGLTIQLTNASNGARGLDVLQAGVGPGVFATSAGGNAVWGITSSISAAGVIGDNTFGEAVVGRNRGGNGVGAVVGRNDSSGYGVRGFNTKDGIGVLGQAGISGGTGVGGRFENVNAANGNDALQAATNGTGWAGNFTNANNSSASKGVRIATTANQGGNALNVANGTIAFSAQHPYASNSTVDDAYLVVTAAGNVTIPTGAPLVSGASVWVVNNAGANISVTNTTVGALTIAPGRLQHLVFISTVSGANWIPAQ